VRSYNGNGERREPAIGLPAAGRLRDKETAKTAVGDRRPGTGIRGPGTRPDGQAGEQTKSNGTWNPPQAGRLWNLPAARQARNLELSFLLDLIDRPA